MVKKNQFIKNIKSLSWYLTHPHFYGEFFILVYYELIGFINFSKDSKKDKEMAIQWCKNNAVNVNVAIKKITGKELIDDFETKFKKQLQFSNEMVAKCPVKMGGPGDTNLLYHLAEFIQAKNVIETGIAYGWSSLSLLLSLSNRKGSYLISIDKPYPGMGNEPYVGCVVPDYLRKNWKIIRLADRKAVPMAIKKLASVDMVHYDSDKSYHGRMNTYFKLWHALKFKGIFVSDDISDNLAFRDFCKKIKTPPIIIYSMQKYVGIIIKN